MTLQESRSNNVLRVIPRTPYDFGGLAAGAQQVVIVAQHIDVSRFREISLAVRLHSGTIGTSSSGTGTSSASATISSGLLGMFGAGGTAGGTSSTSTSTSSGTGASTLTTDSGGGSGPPGLPDAGPYIAVVMAADLWTLEDPGTEIMSVTPGSPFAVAAFTSQTPNPGGILVSPTVPFGRRVSIAVLAAQAQGTAVALNANLSIDLIMKGGEETADDPAYNAYLGYR